MSETPHSLAARILTSREDRARTKIIRRFLVCLADRYATVCADDFRPEPWRVSMLSRITKASAVIALAASAFGAPAGTALAAGQAPTAADMIVHE